MVKIYLRTFFFALVFSTTTSSTAQQIRFNEVVSSNSFFFDEDGDTPDWFELHNFGNSEVSLNDWTVTDKLGQPGKWVFPDVVLEADSYMLVWASGKDRLETGVARTLITQGDTFKYIVPAQAVNGQWTSLGFDDTGWDEGMSGFGYGDGDDATTMPQGSSSVFLRKKFTVSNTDAVKELLLDIDYDDAFVAYINGVEVARANINGIYPAFNAAPNTDHEATIYQGGAPDRFAVANITDVLLPGENVLCIQAHNISSTSSDFTIIPFLSAIYAVPTTEGIPPPDVLRFNDQALHTNFKISSGGETLYLFNAVGTLVDSIFTNDLPPDVSLGISVNNGLAFFETPTPGLPNTSIAYYGINNEHIEFSHPGGPVGAISLSLNGISPPNIIRYTLDATIPNENSPIYSSPISISQNRVVRARVFRTDYIPSKTQSHTYLINVSHQLPVISLVTEPDNFFDDDNGIYVLGDDYDFDFPHFGANFWEDWERPIHFTFHEPDGSPGISFDAGTKIFGGWSRANDQRSLSIFARNKYGIGEINYPLFPDQNYTTFQSFVLRNSGNDWLNTMLRDATLTGLMKDSGLEFQAYRPAVTYLNGEYWGFYNMREKINEHFLASKHNLDPNDIDLLELNGEIIFGDNQEYIDLLNFINTNNLAFADRYEYVVEKIDVENFIIYQVAQIYFDNTDWPGNNIKFWKTKNGKWRWILFDTDFGFGVWENANYLKNTLAFALQANGPGWPNPPWSTFLFRKLTQNTAFRNEFINRFADELNSRFLPDNVCEHIDSMAAGISSEINAHYNRWGGSIGYMDDRMESMKRFANLRSPKIKQHILSQFGLPAYHALTIENADPSKGYVKVNRLTINENKWTGDYFENVPIKVVVVPNPGNAFLHWSGGSISTDPEIKINLKSATTLIPVFEGSDIEEQAIIIINEINYNSNEGNDTGDWVELHNLNSTTADLSGWVLKDSDDANSFVLPQGTIITGEGYLILTKEINKFKTIYPNIENVIGDFGFGLSGDSDAVRLFDNAIVLHDEVNYLSVFPWPIGANAEGPTIELKHPSLDNSLPGNWAVLHAFGSPGQSNIDTVYPFNGNNIEDLKYFPNPFTDQINITFCIKKSTTIKATLYDMRGSVIQLIFDGALDPGEYHLDTDLDFLSRGVYLLEFIEGNENKVTSKLVKF